MGRGGSSSQSTEDGESPGVLKIPTELVKVGGDAMIEILISVYNKTLKTGVA